MRLVGRIVPCANRTSASEVSLRFCSRKTISVQYSSVWSIICPENFHQNSVCDRDIPENSGHWHLQVLKRLANKMFSLVNTEKYFLVPSQKLDCLGADRVLSEWIVSLLESKCISALEEVKWSFSTPIHRLLCSFFVCWDLRFLHPRCFYGLFRVIFVSIWRWICTSKHSNWT